MNVSLTPELEKFVEDTVATGRYGSASEVVRAALRTFEQEQQWVSYAKKKIEIGLEEMRAGKFITSEDFLAELEERKKVRKKSA
jgi:antitoxin ParD1/3/4